MEAQQYPWFTQNRSNIYFYNPAYCGTRRVVDFRAFYRNQWTGYTGAPKTMAATLNFRYAGGKLGTGLFVYQDNIGPFQNNIIALSLAYHLKFDDVELSFGGTGTYYSQWFNGNKVTLHNQIDQSVNLYVSDKATNYDGSFGLMLYNDRFHFGMAMNNMVGAELLHYTNDPDKKGKYTNVNNFVLNAGYNFSEDPEYIFESSIMALYTSGVPFYFDYTLRMHVHNAMFGGFSIRFKDAIALHLGITFKKDFQICYSYDVVTSPLRKFQKGSHDITLIFSTNAGTDKKRRGFNGKFLKQKFQYLL
jgi:type IX secretion system PorP/SprF family membrane protein